MLEVWTIVAMAVCVTYLVSRLGQGKRLPPCKGGPRRPGDMSRPTRQDQRVQGCTPSTTQGARGGAADGAPLCMRHPLSPAGSDLDLESQLAMNYEIRRSRAVEALQLQYDESIKCALHNPVYHR